jgi:asparagine synthase (glutamine-hydrolysing)
MRHRGPDSSGFWVNKNASCALAHNRLAVIDVTDVSAQPMVAPSGTALTYNGEIYNFRELRSCASARGFRFRSASDTEAILASYEQDGFVSFQKLRGMFAFGIWDEPQQQLVLVRDRFGIKPLYYCTVGDNLYFASEIKALLPFLPRIATNNAAFAEYLTFQYTISGESMFEGVSEVPPGHYLVVAQGRIKVTKYWDVSYNINHDHRADEFESQLVELMNDSVRLHLQSDVAVGSYVSGGLDSSLIHTLASRHSGRALSAFHGRFPGHEGFDESYYAQEVTNVLGGELQIQDISAQDFVSKISNVVYHLDQPVAGPGAFPQFMVSELASKNVKVVLGGQGGDEIFGGYVRYLIAYFEQCIKQEREFRRHH